MGEENQARVDLSDPKAFRDLARTVIALLRKWDLTDQQQLTLLGGDPQDNSVLQKYEDGEWPRADSREVLQRVGHLLGIHSSLRYLFPLDEGLRFSWVRRHNQALGGSAPLDIMLQQGTEGIARVRAMLDEHRMQ